MLTTFGGIFAAILIAVLISSIFYFALNIKGPWGSFWTFFIVLMLIIWAANLWVRPIGPAYWGVSWIPLIFIGIIFALLLSAIPSYDTRPEEGERKTDQRMPADQADLDARRETDYAAAAAVGWIFWTFIIILFLAVIIGYWV